MRLVAFGCSYTYGQGLEDCFVLPNNPGPHPSVYAWPQLVADMLNVECINKSAPASSNKQILDTLLQFDFNSDDIVLIMWTFTNRWCTINELGEYNIFAQYKCKTIQELEFYDKLFTKEDSQIDFIYRANFAKLFLDSKNMFNYHFTVSPKLFLNTLPNNVNKWNSIKFLDISLDDYRLMFPPALDTSPGPHHPGPLAHKSAAELIFKEIKNAHNK